MRRTSEKKRGFTVVEVMVSLAVIAILAAFAYGNLMQARKKARDTKRTTDLEHISVALRAYRDSDAKGFYPSYPSGSIVGESPTGIDADIAPSMPNPPHDPLGPGNSSYRYVYDSDYNCPNAGGNVTVLYAENVETLEYINWDTVCDSSLAGSTSIYGLILSSKPF